MLIRYVGFGTRLIGPYRWDEDNGHVADVDDVQVAANLLTYPRPEFELDVSEPLLETMTADEVVNRVVEQATARPSTPLRAAQDAPDQYSEQ